jgi:Na+-driven multidrug efflux pump
MAQLKGTYKEIINITLPLMIGNLCNTLIAVFDVIFMSRYDVQGNTDLATIGYVTMFYLVLVLIGYNFSKGAQILIAKSTGEGDYKQVGNITDHCLVLLLLLSAVLCVFLMLFFKPLFALVVHNDAVANEGALFMTYRAPGIIFNFAGLVLISYFTGTNRTKILGVSMFVMSAANILLNYLLIFGHWAFRPWALPVPGWP